jgi:putative transposase
LKRQELLANAKWPVQGPLRTAPMKQRHHTPEQVIRKLADGEKLLGEGKSIDEVARHLEITESTWHRWRNQHGGMKADDAKKLERENVALWISTGCDRGQ